MRRILAVGFTILMLSGIAGAKGGPTEWWLRFERTGGTPRLVKGKLVLTKAKRDWSGTLAFKTVLGGREHRLTGVVFKGAKVLRETPSAFAMASSVRARADSGSCRKR